MTKDNDPSEKAVSNRTVWYVFIAIIGLWMLAVFVFTALRSYYAEAFLIGPQLTPSSIEWLNAWGTFGDTFNVINTLFSALAFAAVAVSLYIQRQDFLTSFKEFRKSVSAQEQIARETQIERTERLYDLAATFHASGMKNARIQLSSIRSLYFCEPKFRKRCASQWIHTETADFGEYNQRLIAAGALPRPGPEENGTTYVKQETSERIAFTWAFSDLIEYYVRLHFVLRMETEKSRTETFGRELAHSYIWPYWRGLLLLHAFEVKISHINWLEKQLDDNRRWKFDHEKKDFFEKSLKNYPVQSWISDLAKFDRACGFPEWLPGVSPHDPEYKCGDFAFNHDFLVGEGKPDYEEFIKVVEAMNNLRPKQVAPQNSI